MTDGEPQRDIQDISSAARPETATEEVHGLELFRRLFQQSPIGVAVVGPEGRPLAVNPALCELLGYPADELQSMAFADFTHPEDVDADVEQYRRLMAAEIQDYSLDKRFLTADGAVIWARLAVAAVHDPQGEVRRAVAFVRDVTEERRFRRELAARHREQAAVARVSRRALEGEDASKLVRDAVEEVAGALETGPVVVLEADREAGLLRPASSAGRPEGSESLRPVPLPETGATVRALASGEPVAADRIDPETREALGELAGSEDGAPELVAVRAADEIWGLLCVFAGGEDGLPDHSRQFLRSVGDLLGQAVRDRRARDALRESERRYRTLFESSRDAVYVTTAEGVIVEMNQAGVEMFGFEEEDEIVGRNARELYVEPGDRDRFRAAVREGGGSVKDFEARLRHRDGEVLHCLLTSTARTDPDGDVIGFQGIIRDVTEQKRMEEELEHRALHDWLTDLPNRALLRDRLETALARAERHAHGVALLFVDLDGFKRVNDRWSHAAGDEVLLEAARRLDGQFREEDTVARMGGDEFVVLLEDLRETGAVERAAERVAAAFEEPFEVGGERVPIDASVGVATHGLEGRSASPHRPDKDVLLHAADQAMYRAKEEPGTGWRLAAGEEDAGEGTGGRPDAGEGAPGR